ncbi:MAG TPA: hypothetical protein VKW04_08705 [Planctomycetota bacterium]|nr:hypothetical protein [Planctomycetota bacterium]
MDQRQLKWTRKALRLDRRVEASIDLLPIVDLELLDRSFRESLLVAKLLRRPSTYLQGRSGAAR